MVLSASACAERRELSTGRFARRRFVVSGADLRNTMTKRLIPWWALQGLNLRPLPYEGNALQKNPMNTSRVCRLRPVLTRFVLGFPGRKRGGWRCVSIGPRRERSGHGICSRSAEVDEAARKSQAQLDERTGDSSNLIGIDADPAPAIAAEASLCRQVAFRLGKRSGILLR